MTKKRKRYEAKTYKINNVQGNPDLQKVDSPFTLPLRLPGWFPDGIDVPWGDIQRVYPEEAIGLSAGVPLPFPVQFSEQGSTKNPHRWILGGRIEEPPAKAAGPMSNLTCLVRELARMVRKYNASLYRLRRLHYCFDYQDGPCPPRNPYGDPATLPPPNSPEFKALARESESDWVKVTTELNDFLEQVEDDGYRAVRLLAADMVEVNGYVVSMRVMVVPRDIPGKISPREAGGSSSHVSISSAFSSS